MARILNLETATTNCSVSLAKDGKVVAIREHNTPNYSHAEQLHVFIQELVDEASLSLDAIDAIAVSKGPGSYTGLRIGVSAAKGLCFALDKPLISVDTLQSLALHRETDGFDVVIPVLDARRMEVYSAVFDGHARALRETEAEIVTANSFVEYTKKGQVLLIGNGAGKCQDIIKHPKVSFAPQAFPSAHEMTGLSYEKFQKHDFEDVAYFEPFYLKDFILQSKKKA